MWKIMPQQQQHQQRGVQFRRRSPVRLSELDGDERGFDGESEPVKRERAMKRDIEEPDAARGWPKR